MGDEPRDPTADPAWFLIGCLVLFLTQFAVYAGLIVRCVCDYLGRA